MNLTPEQKSIREIFNGYCDTKENTVTAYGGRLNVRPPYQRKFFYNIKKSESVIETVLKNLPLNVIYWAKDENGNYELLDGQQRIISICKYLRGDYPVNGKFFADLTKEEQEQLLNYELTVFILNAGEKEKIDWFRALNMGEKLSQQELRNALYKGRWLESAKEYFSKPDCPASKIGSKYLKGSPARHDYLETVLDWIAYRQEIDIEDYMEIHQNDDNADELWIYFEKVINWTEKTFPYYIHEMQGVNWGRLYNKYRDNNFDINELEIKISDLMANGEIRNKQGIYEYIFDNNEKHLCLREFSEELKMARYEFQERICPFCHAEKREKYHYEFKEMVAHKILNWEKGGKTNFKNCILLCKDHHF